MKRYTFEEILAAYKKFNYNPIFGKFIDKKRECCCPVTVIYCLESNKNPDEVIDDSEVCDLLVEENYLSGLWRGFDAIGEANLRYDDDDEREGYAFGWGLRQFLSGHLTMENATPSM